MACCKCGSRWGTQKVVYKDKTTGEDYCVFHAPANEKGVSVDTFNELVHDRIQEVVNLGDKATYCDMSDTVFSGDISFSQFDRNNPMPSITFAGSVFLGEANFGGVVFSGGGEFEQSIFDGKATFSGAVLKKGIEFGVTTFNGDAWFEEAVFERGGWFYKATFNKDVGFNKSVFKKEAEFTRATFSDVWFGNVVFDGIVYFNEATFKRETSFKDTTFNGYTWFSRNKFYRGAEFKLAKFLGETKVDRVEFKHAGCFSQAALQNVEFSDIPDSSKLVFERCQAGEVYFYRVGLRECDFVQTNITHFHFIDSHWPELDGCFYREPQESPHSLHSLRDFYQRMKRKYKDEHNEYEASKWHMAEKEAHLRILTDETNSLRNVVVTAIKSHRLTGVESISDRFVYHLLRMYKASSGFGEKPFQALLWLMLFILLPVMPYLFPGDMRCYIPLLKVRPEHGTWVITHLWMGAWQLLITLQAALFVFALRNRFRR